MRARARARVCVCVRVCACVFVLMRTVISYYDCVPSKGAKYEMDEVLTHNITTLNP